MLHSHSVSPVYEFLVGNKRGYGGGAVKGIFARSPVEVGDGVKTAVGARLVYNAVTGGFFKYDLSVLAPELDNVGSF